MIVLDTNVVSELMSMAPADQVVSWIDRRRSQLICTTAVTVMEIRTGILKLPKGRRKSDLERGFADALSVTMHDRILPFDLAAAEATAVYVEQLRRSGHSIETVDAQIAGTVIACRARLATRNTSHFPDLPVAILNPWTD